MINVLAVISREGAFGLLFALMLLIFALFIAFLLALLYDILSYPIRYAGSRLLMLFVGIIYGISPEETVEFIDPIDTMIKLFVILIVLIVLLAHRDKRVLSDMLNARYYRFIIAMPGEKSIYLDRLKRSFNSYKLDYRSSVGSIIILNFLFWIFFFYFDAKWRVLEN